MIRVACISLELTLGIWLPRPGITISGMLRVGMASMGMLNFGVRPEGFLIAGDLVILTVSTG